MISRSRTPDSLSWSVFFLSTQILAWRASLRVRDGSVTSLWCPLLRFHHLGIAPLSMISSIFVCVCVDLYKKIINIQNTAGDINVECFTLRLLILEVPPDECEMAGGIRAICFL